MSYSDLLKDPRWQRKRLEVLGREAFTCEECGDMETTLHVHHMYYRKGWKPWDYPTDSLRCLCERCHTAMAEAQEHLQEATAWMSIEAIVRIIGTAHGDRFFYEAARDVGVWSVGSGSVVPPPSRLPYAVGVARSLDIRAEDLLAAPDERILSYDRLRELVGSPVPEALCGRDCAEPSPVGNA